jgi:[acyl-carrier-protein] S-malonyltransferase
VDTFVEVGAGNVLSGLIRRIDRKVKTFSVGDPGGVAALAEWLSGEA